MRILSALNSLATFPRDLSLNSLSKPCDPKHELHKLETTVTELKATVASVRPPEPWKIKELVARCEAAQYRLEGFQPREIRLMAWDNTLLMNPDFRFHLAECVRAGTVKPKLLILSKVYFANWGRHVQPEVFEQMLRILAIEQNGYTPVLRLYKEYANSIFDGKANVFLSQIVFSSKRSLLSVLEEWDVPGTTPLASAVIDSYVSRLMAEFSYGQASVLEELTAILDLPAVSASSFQKAAETMILSELAERSDTVRKKVEMFVLDHGRLGDPRLPQNIPKWVGIDTAAKRRFTTWRATKDLVFFFKAVMRDGNDPHGRKDFWLEYIDKVVDSVVALCPTDLQRLRLSLDSEHVHYCRIRENQKISCFMMRFRGASQEILVAEFSNVGMVRIFDYDTFVKNVGTINKEEFRITELKTDAGMIDGFSHFLRWQSNVRGLLAQFGIRPR